jgi:hypothetical protein
MMDTQFTDPLSHGRHIARMTIGKAARDQRPRSTVPVPRSPFAEGLGLLQFEHEEL